MLEAYDVTASPSPRQGEIVGAATYTYTCTRTRIHRCGENEKNEWHARGPKKVNAENFTRDLGLLGIGGWKEKRKRMNASAASRRALDRLCAAATRTSKNHKHTRRTRQGMAGQGRHHECSVGNTYFRLPLHHILQSRISNLSIICMYSVRSFV